MRKAGPNGMSVVGPRSHGMNDHGGATSVHADQDVFGTPLTQLMDGRAPSLFRHDSPDGHNHDARLMLLNLWIPLQQITQPLVLADGRSIDRRRHQLRYGLATETFLERDDDMAVNDIWTFLHDPDQRWYLRSDMDHRHAYVFNTLSTPHSACTLPGEDVAERCYRSLEDAEAAVARGDVAAARRGGLADSAPGHPERHAARAVRRHRRHGGRGRRSPGGRRPSVRRRGRGVAGPIAPRRGAAWSACRWRCGWSCRSTASDEGDEVAGSGSRDPSFSSRTSGSVARTAARSISRDRLRGREPMRARRDPTPPACGRTTAGGCRRCGSTRRAAHRSGGS